MDALNQEASTYATTGVTAIETVGRQLPWTSQRINVRGNNPVDSKPAMDSLGIPVEGHLNTWKCDINALVNIIH